MARASCSSVSRAVGAVLLLFVLGAQVASASRWWPQLYSKCLVDKHPDVSDLAGADYVSRVRTARIRSGRTYRYVHYRPKVAEPRKPTVLFVHGFPSSSYDWRRQFQYLVDRGFGVFAPDLLGYGGTDKPSNASEYLLKTQAQEIIELLACAGVDDIVGVGHDLGSNLLSRVADYYPNRALKYAFLDIGYTAPPVSLNEASIDAQNAKSLKTAGYEPSGYWSFFNETGTGGVLDAHQDSFFSVTYNNASMLKTVYGPTGALEAWLKADKQAPLGGLVSAEDEAIHNRIFAPEKGGYEPALNHYRALYQDLNKEDEMALAKTAGNLTKPVLLLTATQDPIGTPAVAKNMTRPYVPDLQVQEFNSSHFIMLEKADEVNKALSDFFDA